MPSFLGLDLSTQQLKAIVIDDDSTLLHESAVNFDRDLPHYKTSGGAHKGENGEVTSPVEMWLEAFDVLFDRMRQAGVDFASIAAISGAGQQHGSVYWSNEAEKLLASLDPTSTLRQQLSPKAFSTPNSPIWQDSSTTKECRDLENAVGGAQALADITGSRAYERFTGPQIMRIGRLRPDVYHATARISLVSSFIPSLFLGAFAPIEVSDASGMNLTNVLTLKWEDKLLEACGGPELRAKLGPEPAMGGTPLGQISSWWVKRFGFNKDCIIAPFTGDNPATVVALSAPGDALLSLGTSTTFLLSIPPSDAPPKRVTTSHLLSHPTTSDSQIAMLCYKNGALARELVRDKYASGDWAKFNDLVESTPPGNDGHIGLYFPLPEIIPPGVKGDFFFSVEGENGEPKRTDDIPASAHPRAILESQMLSIRSRIADILPEHAPHLHRLVITGGTSANVTIRQFIADLFDMDVYVSVTKEAGGMGGALLAKYAWSKHNGLVETFEEMTGGEGVGLKCVATPSEKSSNPYERWVDIYKKCEDEVVRVSEHKA